MQQSQFPRNCRKINCKTNGYLFLLVVQSRDETKSGAVLLYTPLPFQGKETWCVIKITFTCGCSRSLCPCRVLCHVLRGPRGIRRSKFNFVGVRLTSSSVNIGMYSQSLILRINFNIFHSSMSLNNSRLLVALINHWVCQPFLNCAFSSSILVVIICRDFRQTTVGSWQDDESFFIFHNNQILQASQ